MGKVNLSHGGQFVIGGAVDRKLLIGQKLESIDSLHSCRLGDSPLPAYLRYCKYSWLCKSLGERHITHQIEPQPPFRD